MRTIFKTSVNGIELQFTQQGIHLSPEHNLDDLNVRTVYSFAQKLHPYLLTLRQQQGYFYLVDIDDMLPKFGPYEAEAAQSILNLAADQFFGQSFNQVGYVYLVRGTNELYKIGRTKQLQRRMKRFEVKLPFEVEVIALIRTETPNIEEKKWHERFAEKRLDGEWFSLDDADVQWMKQYDFRSTESGKDDAPEPGNHLWKYGDRSDG